MKSIVLAGLMMGTIGMAHAKEPTAYLVDMSIKQLVYVGHVGQLDQRQQRTFTYNEVLDWAPDYIFVSQMRADCAVPGRMQKQYLMAFHTKALRGQHTDLSHSEKQWAVYGNRTAERGAWLITCKGQQTPLSLHDIFDRYHAFLKGAVIV